MIPLFKDFSIDSNSINLSMTDLLITYLGAIIWLFSICLTKNLPIKRLVDFASKHAKNVSAVWIKY